MPATHTRRSPHDDGAADLHALIDAHPASAALLLRCLRAGWATPHDLHLIEPVIEAVQACRLTCFTALEKRRAAPAGTRLHAVGHDAATPLLPTFALYFTRQCIDYCHNAGLREAAAFLRVSDVLALRLHGALRAAHEKNAPDAPDAPASASDDRGHAAASAQPDVENSAELNAIEHALALHARLFDDLYQGMRQARLMPLSDRIQARLSLELAAEPALPMYPGVGEIMCVEQDDRRRIAFTVERYPCSAEVLDPRVVRIPPGKTNNLHKHAHETLFYFISGTGRILVGTRWVQVKPGDAVFAPRWAMHQTDNTGVVELVLLAITDYYLTSSTYVGKYEKI